jgi:hypothetical protein
MREVRRMFSSVDDHVKTGLHSFFINSCVPIITRIGDQFAIIGTGTLFNICNRRFLFTAAHIADDYDVAAWAFPTDPHSGEIHTFGLGDGVKSPELDVLIFELKDTDVLRLLESKWRFLTLSNVWLPDFSADAVFVAGYPSIRATFEGNRLNGHLFILRRMLRTETPTAALHSEDAVRNGIDFFVDHIESINELTGENVGRERVQGMSGCTIWAYRAHGWDRNWSVWSPELTLRVIGIQSAAVQNNYIRAKSWSAALQSLGEHR